MFSYYKPQYVLSDTIMTGGDVASHYAHIKYMKEQILPNLRLTGWYMGNYAGYPFFVFHFPFLFIIGALLGYVIPLTIAFKLVTMLGVFLLPLSCYFFIKILKFKDPTPIIMAIFSIPFLFNEGSSAWGGNILSSIVGEIGYSIGFAAMILYLAFAYAYLAEGKYFQFAIIAFFLTGFNHVYTLIVGVICPLILLLPKDTFVLRAKRLLQVYGITFLLLGFWIIPFILNLQYATMMAHKWGIGSILEVFPIVMLPFVVPSALIIPLLWMNRKVRKDQRAWFFLWSIAICFILYKLYFLLGIIDIRFLPPLQIFCIFTSVYVISSGIRKIKISPFLLILFLILVLFWVHIHVAKVDDRIKRSFEGYESLELYPTFSEINSYLNGSLNDSRAIFEDGTQDYYFGSRRAFENLPLFSGRPTLQGKFLQSALSAPFINYMQSLISQDRYKCIEDFGCVNGLSFRIYDKLDLYNVKYIGVSSKESKEAISRDINYKYLATFDQYKIFEYLNHSNGYVFVPKYKPVRISTGHFKQDSFIWFLNYSYDQPIVNDFNIIEKDYEYFNPVEINHVNELSNLKKIETGKKCNVTSNIYEQRIEFTTDCIGIPHIVKVSYFPNWKVKGAGKVYYASPAFLLVIPNQKNVELSYGTSLADYMGIMATLIGIVWLIMLYKNKLPMIVNLGIFDHALNLLNKIKFILLALFVVILVLNHVRSTDNVRDDYLMKIGMLTRSNSVCEFVHDKEACDKYLKKYSSKTFAEADEVKKTAGYGHMSLALYYGNSPYNLTGVLNGPLELKGLDINKIGFGLADPFMIEVNNTWYLFFEIGRTKGIIGLAESTDLVHWDYEGVVLEESFHLSYPQVFEWNNEYYMIPESEKNKTVRLYKAQHFPFDWKLEKILLNRTRNDNSIFYFNDTWWMFSAQGWDTLYLYYADNPLGPWTGHKLNPIIEKDMKYGRPGGRVVVWNGHPYRFTQKDYPRYGMSVTAFEITELSKFTYHERVVTEVIGPGNYYWNSIGMHHIDAHQISDNEWIAVVDSNGAASDVFAHLT